MQKKLLIETLTRFYQISGFKNPEVIAESKATEAQAMNILRSGKVEKPEEIISDFRDIDEEGGKHIPAMAYFYIQGETTLNNYKSVFKDYFDLVKKKRIERIQVTKRGVVMGDNVFSDFLTFGEYVHGKANNFTKKPKGDNTSDTELKGDHDVMWSGNGIEIYDGNDVGKCIQYTMGGLTGKTYGFCIGQPGNTMWQSYRDSKTSTFYYIIDTNKELQDPLHIVVFDTTKYGVELTDANNNTKNIAEYGADSGGYIEYLESKGVPVKDMMPNKEKTPQEIDYQERFGQENHDLKWFMQLTPEEKSNYIGRGHQLSDEQFDFLLN